MRRFTSIVITLVVVMLLAAGCSSGGEDISVQQLGGGNTTPGQEDDAIVVEDDGASHGVSFVGDGFGVSSPAVASAVVDRPQTPAVVNDDVRREGLGSDWCDLRNRVRRFGQDWYARKFQVNGAFRYTWEDTKVWCQRQREFRLDARAILIGGVNNVSDTEARAQAHEDGVEHPERLPVFRYSELINTRGLERHELNEFVDGQSQIRVALLPLVRTSEGLQLDLTEGVFTDCLNRWRANFFGFFSTPMRPDWHGPTGNPPGTPPGNPHNPPTPPPPTTTSTTTPNNTTSTTTPNNTTSTTTPNNTTSTTTVVPPCVGPNCPKDDTGDVNTQNPVNPVTGCGQSNCGGNNGDIPYVPAPPLPVFTPSPTPAPSPPPPGGVDTGGTAPPGSADTPSGPVPGPDPLGTTNPAPSAGSGDDHIGVVTP